jgi:hypothetical protein
VYVSLHSGPTGACDGGISRNDTVEAQISSSSFRAVGASWCGSTKSDEEIAGVWGGLRVA